MGRFMFVNGDVFEGEMKDGKRHGSGKYMFIDGDMYAGDWKKDKSHGKGKYMFVNGDVYKCALESWDRPIISIHVNEMPSLFLIHQHARTII